MVSLIGVIFISEKQSKKNIQVTLAASYLKLTLS